MARVTSLDVFFQNALMTRWDTPPDYECRYFTCDELPAVIGVAWNNLPLTKVAAFYETDDCTYSSSTFTYNTGSTRRQLTGAHRFTRPQIIRSMMVGHTEAALLDEKLSIKKPTTSSKKTEKPNASSKKTAKPATSDKKTPKPTTANNKTKAPTTTSPATEKPATLGKKKTTRKEIELINWLFLVCYTRDYVRRKRQARASVRPARRNMRVLSMEKKPTLPTRWSGAVTKVRWEGCLPTGRSLCTEPVFRGTKKAADDDNSKFAEAAHSDNIG